MSLFPSEILYMIASFMDVRSLLDFSMINKECHRIAWKHFVVDEDDISFCAVYYKKTVKRYIISKLPLWRSLSIAMFTESPSRGFSKYTRHIGSGRLMKHGIRHFFGYFPEMKNGVRINVDSDVTKMKVLYTRGCRSKRLFKPKRGYMFDTIVSKQLQTLLKNADVTSYNRFGILIKN